MIRSSRTTWVGLDWGDQTHHVWIIDDEGRDCDDFAIDHSAMGMATLVERLRAYGDVGGIAIETDRYLVVAALIQTGFTVYPINPKVAHRWAECFDVDPATSDPQAAHVLALGLRVFVDQCRPLVPDDAATAELAERCAAEKDLINERTALANRLKACIKTYYPDFLGWFNDLTKTSACDFLEAFPTAQALRDTTPRKLRAFLKVHRIGLSARWQERIKTRRNGLVWAIEPGRELARADRAVALAGQVRLINVQLRRARKTINTLFKAHPDAQLFASMPGAGEKLAPRLLAHFGSDRNRWPSAEALQVLGGTVPVTRKSGKCKHQKLFRWACQKRFRNTLRDWAFSSLSHSVWARAFYDRARARKQSHECALRNLAAKWLKILFRVWQDRTPYDERRYLRSLQQHGSPLIAVIRQSKKCGEVA